MARIHSVTYAKNDCAMSRVPSIKPLNTFSLLFNLLILAWRILNVYFSNFLHPYSGIVSQVYERRHTCICVELRPRKNSKCTFMVWKWNNCFFDLNESKKRILYFYCDQTAEHPLMFLWPFNNNEAGITACEDQCTSPRFPWCSKHRLGGTLDPYTLFTALILLESIGSFSKRKTME